MVIAPSQDYFDDPYDAAEEDSDKEQEAEDPSVGADDEDSANQNSQQQQQPCGFVDFRDRKDLWLPFFMVKPLLDAEPITNSMGCESVCVEMPQSRSSMMSARKYLTVSGVTTLMASR